MAPVIPSCNCSRKYSMQVSQGQHKANRHIQSLDDSYSGAPLNIASVFGTMPKNIQRLPRNVRRLIRNIQGLLQKIQAVSYEVQGVLSDIQKVSSDIQELPSDIQQVPSDIQQVPSDIQQVPSDIQKLPSDIQQVPSDIQQVPSDIQELSSNKRGMPKNLQDVLKNFKKGLMEFQKVLKNLQVVLKSNIQGVPKDIQGMKRNMEGVLQNTQGVIRNFQGVLNIMQKVLSSIPSVPWSFQEVLTNSQEKLGSIRVLLRNIQGTPKNDDDSQEYILDEPAADKSEEVSYVQQDSSIIEEHQSASDERCESGQSLHENPIPQMESMQNQPQTLSPNGQLEDTNYANLTTPRNNKRQHISASTPSNIESEQVSDKQEDSSIIEEHQSAGVEGCQYRQLLYKNAQLEYVQNQPQTSSFNGKLEDIYDAKCQHVSDVCSLPISGNEVSPYLNLTISSQSKNRLRKRKYFRLF